MNEPVAWMDYLEHSDVYDLNVSGRGIPLYTHPVKEQDTDCQYCKQGCIRCDARKQLTDEEIKELSEQHLDMDWQTGVIEFAKAILRKAQEK